jgi:hypothetical protein
MRHPDYAFLAGILGREVKEVCQTGTPLPPNLRSEMGPCLPFFPFPFLFCRTYAAVRLATRSANRDLYRPAAFR